MDLQAGREKLCVDYTRVAICRFLRAIAHKTFDLVPGRPVLINHFVRLSTGETLRQVLVLPYFKQYSAVL